jgi:N-acetylglucosamine kinase-like BadF-type ATPase
VREHGDALALATRLVQQAPELAAETIAALDAALARDGSALAAAIARVLAGVAARTIDVGVALPELAEACATLASADASAREAARYRVETLLPVARVDVPSDRLRRR